MALEKFHYTTKGGDKIALTKFKHVPAGVVRKTRKSSMADQVFSALEAVADEAALTAIDEMTSEELNSMVEAWQVDSGVTVPESSASSTS